MVYDEQKESYYRAVAFPTAKCEDGDLPVSRKIFEDHRPCGLSKNDSRGGRLCERIRLSRDREQTGTCDVLFIFLDVQVVVWNKVSHVDRFLSI